MPEDSSIQAEIARNRYAFNADTTIDIHTYQLKRRIAKTMAVFLDEREITREMWELAERIVAHSTTMKEFTLDHIHEFSADEIAVEAGRYKATRDIKGNERRADETVLKIVARWKDKYDGEWMNRKDISEKLLNNANRAPFKAVNSSPAEYIIAWLRGNSGQCDGEWGARGAKYQPS